MMAVAQSAHEAARSSTKGFVRRTKDPHEAAQRRTKHGFPPFSVCGFLCAGRAKPSTKGITPPLKGVYSFVRRSRELSL